jgi:hypothetical protein
LVDSAGRPHPEGPAITDKRRLITKWNVLALVVLVVGTILTVGLSQLWIMHWSQSGVGFPIGVPGTIDVEGAPGAVLVYYESPHSVPAGHCSLYVRNPYEERLHTRIPMDDHSYRVSLTGWTGRALWELDLDEPGTYEFLCTNANFKSDDDVPAEDRIVFFKEPQSLAVVRGRQKLLKIVGGTITVAIAIGLYIMHGLALRRLAAEPPDGGPDSE